jgi:hypothetical protein
MSNTPALRSPRVFVALTVAAIIGGAGGEAGAAGQGGGGGVGGAAGGVVGGVAEYASMMSGAPLGGSPGNGGLDPDMLFIKVGNEGPACGGSFSYDCKPGVLWEVSIGLPPAMQVPGVYSLSDPAIMATATASGSDPGNFGEPAACWGSGGSFTEGTIQVIDNDGLTIVVKIQGTGDWTEFDADGQYSVPICQWGLD